MSNTVIKDTYLALEKCRKAASIAQVGGFRPPDDELTSWFGGQGFGLAGESLPQFRGKDMFVLLQVNVSELPVIPEQLSNTALLVVFINGEEYPFDRPHGDGWEIREYTTLDGLQPLPEPKTASPVKKLPIRWHPVHDDSPDWENAWELVDLTAINEEDGADEKFFSDFNQYPDTKFGGYPASIQHGAELEGFVFQIGSEEKAGWMWVDNGIGYFNRDPSGNWVFDCQFY